MGRYYWRNILVLFKSLARMAVQRLANDPVLRAKVASVVKEKIVPRAKEGWEQAKPKLEQTKEQLKQDWELAKPELQKAKERARELAKRLRN